jgi:hypothetical protein
MKSDFGGQSDEESCISPTLIDETSLDSLIMKDDLWPFADTFLWQ